MKNNNWNHGIQKTMLNSVNRRIIEYLHDENLSFTELLNKIDNHTDHGKFGYHLRMLREFITLEPTTRKYCLTDRGEFLAEAIRDFRFLSSRGREAARYAEDLKIRDHAVAFYSDDDFKRKISFPFLEAGLSRGEAAVYFVSEDKLDSEIREIRKYGIDCDRLPNEALTIISATEWYLRKGRAKTILTNWQMLIQKKKKAGFTGVHIAAEATDLVNIGLNEELLRFDESLGRQLVLDVCGLCLYNKNMLEEGYFLRIFKCHGHIISKELVGKTVA